MAHGLEGRTPMLDPVVADIAFRLPDRLKINGRMRKYLLRKWLAERLPGAEAFAAKKGFTVPVGEWISIRAQQLADPVARCAGIRELCHPDKVRDLFITLAGRRGKREGIACWLLLFYALWHRIHIEGLSPDMDVWATLEA